MRSMAIVLLLLVIVALAGCGGSGGGGNNANTTGGVSGQVAAPNAQDYRLLLDGKELDQAPGSDGSFTIRNLPPGNHSLAVVGGGGFSGAHIGFVVDPGDVVDIGDILPQPGGQIAGIVSKTDGNGNLAALEGVEVIADAEPIYYIQQGSTEPGIWPPRDGELVQFRAITNANGSYLIPAVPAGAYVVTVNVPGLVQGVQWVYVSPGVTSPADFQLIEAIEPGVGTVTGTVLGTGEGKASAPLEGACVTISSDGTWRPKPPPGPVPLPIEALVKALVPKQATAMIPPPYQFDQFSTLTDAAGRYTLNVPSGHLSLSVWAEGYDGAWDAFTLQPGETLNRDYEIRYWDEVPPPDEPITDPPTDENQ